MQKGLIISILIFIHAVANAQTSVDVENYINTYKHIALEHEELYGIPATITLAQGILESGAGKSPLACNANNHFGIKAGKSWDGLVYLAWDDETQKSEFRKYNSVSESFEDHAKVLKGNRYRNLFHKSVYDYRGWAIGLQSAGYATAPNYAAALIGYIEAYKLYAINGGVKLKPGKTIAITEYITKEQLHSNTELQLPEEEESEEERIIHNASQKFVVEINGVRCTLLYPGESLRSIALKYNIPKSKILKFNEVPHENAIKEGDIVFLNKKKSKYTGSTEYYCVKEDDTLYSISQKFGIRVSSLAKMNKINLFTKLQLGRRLRLK